MISPAVAAASRRRVDAPAEPPAVDVDVSSVKVGYIMVTRGTHISSVKVGYIMKEQ